MEEIWVPVVGFTDYSISNLGRVKSYLRNRRQGRLIKPDIAGSHGRQYFRVEFFRAGECARTRFMVHILVAKHFIGEKPNGVEVNHKDGNKLNNNASNLEYVTHADNMKHSFIMGLQSQEGSKNSRAKLTERDVREIRSQVNVARKVLANKYKVSIHTIYSILYNKTWKYKECYY